MKVFRSRESRDAFSRHAASQVPTVDPGPGSWPGPNNDTTCSSGTHLARRTGSGSLDVEVSRVVKEFRLEYSV